MSRRVPFSVIAPLSALLVASPALGQTSILPDMAPAAALSPAPEAPVSGDSAAAAESVSAIFGLSGSLRVAVLQNSHPIAPALLGPIASVQESPQWVAVHGTSRPELLGEPVYHGEVIAPATPGMWRLQMDEGAYVTSPASLTFITTRPFAEKRAGRLNGYHIGTYPTEGSNRVDEYAPPAAFIEVTPENQDVQISEHFRLRQFLTKDQFDVWPKYVALNLRLIDKLELVLQELNAMGVRAIRIHVMSGFRTPQYNGPGGDGRAALSRHMYGDAADIWVDGDEDGYIDDLNGDGRNDIRDAQLLLRAVERVEQKFPDLTGGAGLYEANSAHGPFVHVDVRGSRVRW